MAVTGYRIDHCTTAGCTPTTQLVVDGGSPFVHTGLTPSSLHRYDLRALDAAGNESTQTAVVEATTPPLELVDVTPPTVPGSPVAAAAAGAPSSSISLTWTAATDNVGVTGYRIDHCSTAGCTPTTQLIVDPASPFVHIGLAQSSLHRYTISALDAAGNRSSATAVVEATTDRGPRPTPDCGAGALYLTHGE